LSPSDILSTPIKGLSFSQSLIADILDFINAGTLLEQRIGSVKPAQLILSVPERDYDST
jgi:hypothetical protein